MYIWVDGLKGSKVHCLTRSGPKARRIFDLKFGFLVKNCIVYQLDVSRNPPNDPLIKGKKGWLSDTLWAKGPANLL